MEPLVARNRLHVWESTAMEVLYVTDEAFHRHDTGLYHPERPARLRAVDQGVRSAGVVLRRLSPRPATLDELVLVHAPEYVAALERFCRSGGGHLDPDTVAGIESWEAALLAAGAGPTAVANLRGGDYDGAFLAVRPPGHHALASRAMGFCLLNNVAVTAAALRAGGERVAILDWDVHHGNGTQDMFEADPEVLYISFHQFPFYPYQGDVDEIGTGEGQGTVVNLPLPAGSAGDVYREGWALVVGPIVAQFQPDWLLISAGYDAHAEDPLAELRLQASDYQWLAGQASRLVRRGRIVIFLEGGYHLPALTSSVAATLQGLSGMEALPDDTYRSPPDAFAGVEAAREILARYWQL
jgi:acetoin utilization deacetylase AcuC-like enzyme